MSHEDPFISVTIAAVKKLSGTGGRVVVEEGGEAHTKNVSAVLQRADGAARQAEVEFVAMGSSRGKEDTSWENVENLGK